MLGWKTRSRRCGGSFLNHYRTDGRPNSKQSGRAGKTAVIAQPSQPEQPEEDLDQQVEDLTHKLLLSWVRIPCSPLNLCEEVIWTA